MTKVGIVNRLVRKQESSSRKPVAAGLAVVASDTGRVLMIQRPLKDGDPNGGKWEMPGGKIDEGETPWMTALREWKEETGLEWPENDDTGTSDRSWDSSDGKYRGYVTWVPREDSFDLNARDLFSDPDSEIGGVVAWVHPRDLPRHNLRPALLSDVDEVMAKVTKWLLGHVCKSVCPVNRLVRKDKGTCGVGERADLTGCTPASGGGEGKAGAGDDGRSEESKPASEKPKKAAPGSQLEPKVLAKLKELGADKLPPADVPASDVKVNLDAGDSGALLTWKQKSRSGRVSQQSAYTAAFHARNAAEKWKRVESIEPHMRGITEGLTARMQDSKLPQRQREAAAIASCIRETGLRPTDGAESVKHGHFGISSLQGRHVKVKGDEVHLDFIGKEGVRNRTVIRDPANVAFVKNAMKSTGPKDFLFKEASSGDAIKALRDASVEAGGPEEILIKDLRTVNATRWGEEAARRFKGPPPPLSGDAKKDAKLVAKAVLSISGEVSHRLNNNPEMARDNYIHPRVFQRWLSTLRSAS